MKFSTGGQFENPPVGNHVARCYGLIDLGTQVHPGYQGGPERVQRDVRISFELPNALMEGTYNPDVAGKPFSVHVSVKQSLHPKSTLCKLLTGWRGKAFSKEDLDKFDPKGLIGKPCRLTLVQNGDYVNVDSISPLGKVRDAKGKMVFEPCPKQVNASVFFSLEEGEFEQAAFDKLHERTQEKIKKSPEWAVLAGGGPGEEPQADPPEDGGAPANSDEPF